VVKQESEAWQPGRLVIHEPCFEALGAVDMTPYVARRINLAQKLAMMEAQIMSMLSDDD